MRRHAAFLLGLVATCWWGMMLVHECGHVVAAVATGGSVAHLEWPVVGFSRTDVAPNPQPMIVAWGGPLLGALLPVLLMLGLRLAKRVSIAAPTFAGFCLLANGAYLSAGAVGRVGDVGEMLRHGCPMWLPALIGVPLAAAGVWQWHALGPRMGLPLVQRAEAFVVVGLGAGLLVASGMCQLFYGSAN